MTESTQTQQLSPELFFDTVNAYQRAAALKGAVELDVFTGIAERAQTAKELAERCGTSERGMRVLCDYLTVIGFLTKSENRYDLTPESNAFLSRRSPMYVGSAVAFLNSPMLMEGFKDVAAIVRKGGTVLPQEGSLAPEHPMWVEFARAMAPMMMLPAELIANLLEAEYGPPWKVLDIAAGHGLFGVTLAKHNRNAEIVAVDWPNVLTVAKETAQREGVADRYRTIAGSAFDVDYGGDYDLVLLTNSLHHFDPPTCERLLRKVHAALKAGGRAVTLEFIPNEDRISPPAAASFSLMMLGTTPSGDAYTFSELERIFRNAGFSSSDLRLLPPMIQQVVISYK